MRYARSILLLALAYFVAAKLGLRLASVNKYATAVWPPTGIALAFLLLRGYRLWPGVLIGAFLANLTTGDTITLNGTLASLGIATGNTLEAWLGAHLVNRFASGHRAFDCARDVFRFAALAAFVSTMVSATVGVTSLSLFGLAKWLDAPGIWLTWWVGDAGGDLVFAPALILWSVDWRLRWNRAWALEAGLVVLALCVLALAALTNVFTPGVPAHLGLAFLCAPALLWAAFRFGPRETAAAMLLVSGFAIWGWLHGMIAGEFSPAYVLLELQAYLGVTSLTILAVAAEVFQRKQQLIKLELQDEAVRRQTRLLDLAHVLVRDIDDRITSWNPGAERLYGFSQAEAIGQVSHALLRTRFPQPIEQIRAKLFATGGWQGELEHRTRDGREVVVASFWALDRDKTGEPQAILEVNNEITELKRAEEAQLRLAAIVESSDDAMMIAKTLDGVITSWNSGAERMYGYGAQEVIGRPISILSPPGHDEEMPATLERIRRGENIEHFETKRRRKDGTLIDVSLTVSSIKSQTGEITGASIVARDVTDRNRLEEQFRQAQKLESIGVLAGGIAHDFNNLLLAILGNASLALDDRTLPHTVRHELQEVVLASERAAELVRQLLVYAGKGVFAIKPVNLGKVVHEITHLIQSSIPKKIDLRFDLASDVPPVAADSGQIQQLVMNLIINAAEAIGENTGTVLVAVGAREIDQSYLRDVFGAGEIMPGWHVVLGVRDTGCGMNDRTKSRIFDPFFTTKFTGRGLGLAAALGIVRRHQGAIKVHSTPHRGTTFEVLLPVMEGRPAPSESAALPGKPSGNGAILVVDDETLVGRTAKAALEHHGYEVILAKSGHEGIELFESRASEIALVLLDMNMPMMGGETAFEQLKKIRPDVRVIVTSGYNEERAVERFGGKRVAGFIQKPYTPRQLAEKVKRVLEAGEGA